MITHLVAADKAVQRAVGKAAGNHRDPHAVG